MLELKIKSCVQLGRGDGLLVSALAYCTEDPNANPAGYEILIIVRKDENKQKSGRGWPIF